MMNEVYRVVLCFLVGGACVAMSAQMTRLYGSRFGGAAVILSYGFTLVILAGR